MLLVHGAFADGSMWTGVIRELQAAGIGVVAVASPLRSLASDAAYVAELYIDREAYPRVFAADLPSRPAMAAAAAQRPITAAAFEEKSPAAAWKTAPSWYIVATADQVIPPEGQQFMARRAHAHTIEIDASHAIALTQPVAVAGHIAAAASSAPRRRHDKPTRP